MNILDQLGKHEQRLGLPAINMWEKMKEMLKDKYFPHSYQERLLNQWCTLCQGSTTVTEYVTKFEELNLSCDVKEEQYSLLLRFRIGLRLKIWRALLHRRVTSVTEMYEKAVDLYSM